VLVAYVRHFNEHRPHRALGQRPPLNDERPLADVIDLDRLRRRDMLGGLIHEYQLATWPDRARIPPHCASSDPRLLARIAQLAITARDTEYRSSGPGCDHFERQPPRRSEPDNRHPHLASDGIPFTSLPSTTCTRSSSDYALGVEFTQEPAEMGPVTTAVFDDTCGNLIQIAQTR
jgi:hypothetical protein